MHGTFVLHLLGLLKLRHPTGGQVTVLKADPIASLLSGIDHFGGDLTLALTKRKRLQSFFHAFLFSQLNQVSYGIGSWRQDEDDGSSIG